MAEARLLQPYFGSSFFTEAFDEPGSSMRPRETNRLEITHVPEGGNTGFPDVLPKPTLAGSLRDDVGSHATA